MAEITAQAVKDLRDLTGLPMMLCKKALVEAGGDQEQAKEFLRREVGKVRETRAENPTKEGRIFTRVKPDGSEAAMIEIQCESEPVGRGQDIAEFGEMLITQLLEGPGADTPEDLLAQPAPGKRGKSLNDYFDEIVNKIREKIVVARVARVPGPVGAYVHHDGKMGVLFQASGENRSSPILRDVAMHIAGRRTVVTHIDELDKAKVQAERNRLAAEAKRTGKPDNIIEKIVDGRMKVFYDDEGVLVVQPFVKEESKTVGQVLAEQGLKAVGFRRWVIGN